MIKVPTIEEARETIGPFTQKESDYTQLIDDQENQSNL